MKKTILAIAIPALFMSAANAATFYDKDGTTFGVTGNLRSNFEQATDNDSGELTGRARMGISAKTAIDKTWSALAFAEWQYTAEDSNDRLAKAGKGANDLNARDVYVGLDGSQYGKFTFGQFNNAFQSINKADNAEQYSGAALLGGNHNDRDEGQIRYDGAWNGFNVAASYVTKDDSFSEVKSTNENLDQAYAVQAGYDAPFGLSVNAAWEDRDYTDTQYKTWGIGSSYTFEGLYVGAMYNKMKAKKDSTGEEGTARGYDVNVSYTIDAFNPYIVYDNVKDLDEVINGEQRTIYTTLGLAYKFTSNFNAYGEYKIDNVATDDVYSVGLKYAF